MTKSNFKKSVLMSFQQRHRYFVTEKRHKIFPFWAFLSQNFWLGQ